VWSSALGKAIRDWVPDTASDEQLKDVDTATGSWLAKIQLPVAARELLGSSAAITVAVSAHLPA
jgi:hypothetical protein